MKVGAAFLGFAVAATLLACEPKELQSIRLPTAEGLVAHWNCDSNGGNVLYDTSGHNLHGHITGGTFTSGKFGNALALARGQYVTVPSFPAQTSSFTVSIWTLLRSGELGYGDVALISTELASTGGWAINLNDATGAQYHFRYYTGTDNGTDVYVSYDCPCLVTDRWVHLVAVVDGEAMTLTFYADGDWRYSGRITQTITPGMSDLMIGHWSPTPKYYAGLIDDVAIYSRALSAHEIKLLRSTAVPDLVVPEQVTFPPDVIDAGESPDAASSDD
jgi:hypothetical protein